MANAATQEVTLPAVMDLDALDGLREALVAALALGPVTVLGGGVERVATNGLMLLLSAAESGRRDGHRLTIDELSAVAQAAIDRLGFTDAFAALARG
jgi:hypothetical protein